MAKKPPTGERTAAERIADAIKRSVELHGTSDFTEEQRNARDELLDAAEARVKELGHLDDAAVARVIDEMGLNRFPAAQVSDGAHTALVRGLESDPGSPRSAMYEVEYRCSIGHEGTALLLFSTEAPRDRESLELAIIRAPSNQTLAIHTRGDVVNYRPSGDGWERVFNWRKIVVMPATDKKGDVLTTGAELLMAFNANSAATKLATLAVDSPALPIPVTGRADKDGVFVITSVKIETRTPARPEILGRFAPRGKLGELERKHKVAFQLPDVEAIREELRQVLEGWRWNLAQEQVLESGARPSPPQGTIAGSSPTRREPKAKRRRAKGRPVGRPKSICRVDGDKVISARGDSSQPEFARWCRISSDSLQRIECGTPVSKKIGDKVIEYCRKHSDVDVRKKSPQKPQQS